MTKLFRHRYGKARVRVLKVFRSDGVHSVKELEVAVLLEGDFESSYLAGDNSKVVPTDTIKNTINVLAHQHLGEEIERFAIVLGEHFVNRYGQVGHAEIDLSERNWQRLKPGDEPHPHSFVAGNEARKYARVICRRGGHTVDAGIRNLVLMKTTGSGFENYPKCEFTTLPETADRILATSFSATWTYAAAPADYRVTHEAVVSAMLKVFAENYSPSAQTTLFQMAEAALSAASEISRIDLAMPNQHCLLIDLSPFGLENSNELFVPTTEPHGQIEATVVRGE